MFVVCVQMLTAAIAAFSGDLQHGASFRPSGLVNFPVTFTNCLRFRLAAPDFWSKRYQRYGCRPSLCVLAIILRRNTLAASDVGRLPKWLSSVTLC